MVGLEPIWQWGVLHDGICNHVTRMHHVLVAGLERDLVDQSLARQSQQSSSCYSGVAPVRHGHSEIVAGLQAQSVSRPGQESVSPRDHPVQAAIQMHDDQRGERRLGGDQGGVGGGRRDGLVEEGDAQQGSPKGLEQGQRGDGILRRAVEADQRALARVEGLGGGDGGGEEGGGRAEHFESRVDTAASAIVGAGVG